MAAAKSATIIDQQKPENDDHRSLLRIAARLLYAKEREEEGTKELMRLAAGVEKRIGWRYSVVITLLVIFLSPTVIGVLYLLSTPITGVDPGTTLEVIILSLAAITSGIILYWRNLQYGLRVDPDPIRTALPAMYGNADKETIETIEKLFAYLAQQTAPRAYYVTRNGTKRYVSRYYFLGRLRGLLFSAEASGRAIVLPPFGFWFGGEIKIEAEPVAIIAALNVKPKQGGAPKRIDYEAILLRLIEHPELRKFEPEVGAVETRFMEHIEFICLKSEDYREDLRVPEMTDLRKFSKRTLAAIKKNRIPKNNPD